MLILASGSKFRKNLLEQAHIKVDATIAADIDETMLKGESQHIYVQRVATEKAQKVHSDNQDSFVIGCDTITCVGKRTLFKPKDAEDARRMLKLMSGRKVNLLTGYCVIAPDNKKSIRYVKTVVNFKRLSKQDIDEYIKTKEWVGVCGGLCIEGSGSKFVKGINGSYANIMGLCPYNVNNILIGLGYNK
ncbi:MAG: Maf family protein [Alphaproteobacteria bacterium]|jgi:septum formation protein|nr:Maf family protein [Alphaproteobacteria bacterium]